MDGGDWCCRLIQDGEGWSLIYSVHDGEAGMGVFHTDTEGTGAVDTSQAGEGTV